MKSLLLVDRAAEEFYRLGTSGWDQRCWKARAGQYERANGPDGLGQQAIW
ncbi:MAG TPA: hypothetical protein VIT43_06255 [Candidatus Dormibacteraeota bacterium]